MDSLPLAETRSTGGSAAIRLVSAGPVASLAARRLTAGYGDLPIVHDLDLHVSPGEVVVLLGANGSGKTTTLLTLAGELAPLAGEVDWLGRPSRSPLHQRCQEGLAFVTEERSVFMGMTVQDNLRVGRCSPADAIEVFPELEAHLDRKVGLLSGGQQQMLALGRALARKPKVLLADELSLGLAPMVVSRLLSAVREAADTGLAVLLVEQHVRKALTIADRVYLLRNGHVAFSGTAAEATKEVQAIEAAYLDQQPE